MKIVIVGAGGRLGAALMREYQDKFDVSGFNHAQLDLSNLDDLREKLNATNFDVLINAAAFTNVDLCETQRDRAFLINAEAPGVLASICGEKNAKLIHFSTDYVFDGEKPEPYTEEDEANPISVYGESKLAGEKNVLAAVGEADGFPGTATPSATVAEPSADGRFTRKRMSPLRRKIAQQLVMAQHTAAILTTFNECDMSAVQQLRSKAQEDFTRKNGVKLGLMSFFIKACVEALKAVPVVNGRIEGDDFIQNNFYDIGVAVGTEGGLVVPVAREADKKNFAELEQVIADFAARAREGKLKIEDLQGGTFTITNGGVYGSLFATPILNPPQSGILGMHKIMPRPVSVNGNVGVRPMMYLALSYDHRAIDGKEAVTFLVKVKDCIENPKKLPLDF